LPSDSVVRELWYCSTVRGISNVQPEKDIVYYGAVIRIPYSKVGTDEQDEYEVDPTSLYSAIREKGEPVSGGIIERYEVFDVATQDLIIMFRIPFHPYND